MSILQRAFEEMTDFELHLVNEYIQGTNKRNYRGPRYEEMDARSAMETLIRKACHIQEVGIELGSINYGMYLREKRRLKKPIKKNTDKLTSTEINDLNESWKEIDDGKAKTFNDVDKLLGELKS
jgi:hypothetical protein